MEHRPVEPAPIAAPTIRVLGEVAWFCENRGFGFVRPDDGGEDVFVTWQQLPGAGFRSLAAGQRCSFARDHDDHGPVAREVHLLT